MPAARGAAGISIFLQDDFIFAKGTLCFFWTFGRLAIQRAIQIRLTRRFFRKTFAQRKEILQLSMDNSAKYLGLP